MYCEWGLLPLIFFFAKYVGGLPFGIVFGGEVCVCASGGRLLREVV